MTRWCSPSDVSVVIPCYSCTETIERAVASVLAQTELPAEIVIVDDCSPDGSRAFIDERLTAWSDRVPVMLVGAERNGGAAAARNLGMDAARGSWIAFLDADDYWLPSKLARQCAAMSTAEATIGGHKVTRDPEGLKTPAALVARTVSYASEYFKNKVPTPTVILRKTALRFNPNLRYAEDHDFWLRYMRESDSTLLYLPEPLTVCVNPPFHRGGLSGNLNAMMRGQLRNLFQHPPNGLYGRFLQVVAISWAIIRYVRRVALWMRASRAGPHK